MGIVGVLCALRWKKYGPSPYSFLLRVLSLMGVRWVQPFFSKECSVDVGIIKTEEEVGFCGLWKMIPLVVHLEGTELLDFLGQKAL